VRLSDRLRRWDAFSHFAPDQLDALEGSVSLDRYGRGDFVVQEGERTRDAYLIESGKVRIQRKTGYGDYVLATLGPGDLFGETAFVDEHERSGSAVAEGDVQVVGFNPEALAGAFEGDRRTALSFYWTFWKSLSRKLRDTNRRLEEFFSRTGGSDDSAHRRGGGEAADFRVDLAAKRKLFEEQRLSRMEINFLTTLSQERRLAPGELLFREGDDGEEMYVVLEGRVMIYKFIPGAGEEALAFLERGDYFGEMALIDREPRSAWARADERGAVVLAIPEDVIGGILDITKVSSLPLLKILCSLVAKRLRELDEKLIGWYILSGGSASEGLPPGAGAPQ
jgi:CRP/FNR family transcriptional regulator, cyclic AMP receptor protein